MNRTDYMNLGGSSAECDAFGVPSRQELGDDNYLVTCTACDEGTQYADDGSNGARTCPECDGTGRVAA